MLTARRLLERREAAAAGKAPPAPQSPPLTEAEVLQARFLAKQDAARKGQSENPAAAETTKAAGSDQGDKSEAEKLQKKPEQGHSTRK